MALLFLGTMLCCVARAEEPVYEIDIPSLNAAEALNRFAEQTGAIMLFSYDLASARQANAVRGRYTLLEGLDLLLRDTGLSGGLSNKRVVNISHAENKQRPGEDTTMLKRKASFGQRFAAFVTSMFSISAASAQDTRAGTPALEEIIVTAQKRGERLQDVPVPVSSVNAEALATQGQVLLRDYYATVPGLNVVPSVQSNQTVSIRGITTGTGNPTVAILIDDVPYGASTNIGGGRFIPEIDPGDLARIEVLRGPQGTLYGASSLGGLLKFVTRDPSTDEFKGTVQAGMSTVHNGKDPGYQLRGSVNVPLGDAWAVRASGFSRRDAGYIDNIRTGEEGVGETDAAGGRVSTLWQPSDTFTLKLSALAQQLKEDGQANADIALPDLQQSRLAGTGWTERDTQSYTATLTAKVRAAEITSLTGYTVNEFSGSTDFGAEILGGFDGSKLTQELRMSMPLGERFDWLLGGYYTHEDSELIQTTIAVDQSTGARLGLVNSVITPTEVTEYAAFTDLTVHFTERFDVQFGLRNAWIRQTFNERVEDTTGIIAVRPELHPRASALTYLITPQLELSPDVMVYARLASGYRPGGANPTPGGDVPAEYEPDKTNNYELGLKADFLDSKVSIDASVYYIDWKDFQFNLFTPARNTYTSNGSRARSRGVELGFGLRPLTGLKIEGWMAWADSVLAENFPPLSTAVGTADDRLPFSSRFAAHLDAEQEFPLWSDLYGFVGAAANRVGERVGPFRASPERQIFPAYTQVDVRAGMRAESWSLDLFVTNLTDERGVLSGGLGSLPATALVYIRPRSIGVSLTKNF